jgi:alpha-ketoglutarate-dependent taurine dioxygenase
MEHTQPRRSGPGNVRRKASPVEAQSLVNTSFLTPETTLPLVITPALPEIDLVSWAEQNRAQLLEQLLQYGGLLLRDFRPGAIAAFEQFASTLAQGPLLDYTYRSTPREKVEKNVFTSTEYPKDQIIPLHNEMSYARTWPLKIWFYAITVAEQGGATPIADSRKVLARLDPVLVERFRRQGVMYVRNYGQGLDLSWQDVFQTTSRAEVESYCQSNGIRYEWLGEDRLRTRQVCQAVARHPQTGEEVWFNQAHLFHIQSLPARVRETLLTQFKEEELPRSACYGDGTPIEPAVIEAISAAYAQETIAFPWQKGDILLLDNMLIAHGRQSFVGARKVVVAMAESFSAPI